LIELGNVKNKPSDYFQGKITLEGEEVCNIYGSYMGFIDFSSIRYWDFRQILPHEIFIDESLLESDHLKRKDL
jgi:hypothetical protein